MQSNDQKYIDGLIDGNQEIFKEIYEKYFPQCRQFVLKNGGTEDDAKDAFQEAIIAVSLRAKSKQIVLTVRFNAYLYRVYRNKWIDSLRKSRTIQPIAFLDVMYSHQVGDNQKEVRHVIFKECFEKLSNDCKQMLTLHFEGKKTKEIANELSLTPNQVYQRIFICRKMLRNAVLSHPLNKELNNSETISNRKKSKVEILNELTGSWSDVGDSIIEEIYQNRTASDKKIDLDK